MFFIRPRRVWGARKPRTPLQRDPWHRGVRIVVHHTADNGPTRDRIFEECAHLRAMQYFHQNVRGWSDIGYNYLIMPSGRVYEGRGYGIRGAHVLGHNADSCGIAFVGTYTTREPVRAQVAAYYQLVKRLANHGAVFTGTVGHGDLMATACPGDGVRRALMLRASR
jgi:N-acetylmuramoyl-L-alanine amidase